MLHDKYYIQDALFDDKCDGIVFSLLLKNFKYLCTYSVVHTVIRYVNKYSVI